MNGTAKKKGTLIIVDVSILPIRPEISAIKSFLDNQLQLDLALIKCIQLNNARNHVAIEFATVEATTRFAAEHHCRHTMVCAGKQFLIPIYIDDDAIDVRIHDVHPHTEDNVIVEHMRHYGEVLSIRKDVWRNFFPGVSNGVRIVRMKITSPIPSYVVIDHQPTMVSHAGQIRTCRTCGERAHAGIRCSQAATKQQQKTASQPETNVSNKKQQSWASLPAPPPPMPLCDEPARVNTTANQQPNNTKKNKKLAHMKRQRSIDEQNSTTKPKKNHTDEPQATGEKEHDFDFFSDTEDLVPVTPQQRMDIEEMLRTMDDIVSPDRKGKK